MARGEKRCFDCGKCLEWVPQAECLNSDQWDAIKAGDWFSKCENATHPNGNCYFRETETVQMLKRKISNG